MATAQQPQVTSVTEVQALDKGNRVVSRIQIKYTVGANGPFTLITTKEDLASGAALQEMRAFANTLALLPQVSQ